MGDHKASSRLRSLENPFPFPSIAERVDWHLQEGTHTLYVCPHPWAIRHHFINKQTGDIIRVRCNLWTCEYCGPRKVDEWRQVVKEAEPVLHLVLTKAGKTVEQAARALTTFMQALRRGSKGRGAGRVGARPAYPVEYFAVLERHEDFEGVGFHWHVLVKGVDFIPYVEVIKPLWKSATHFNKETGEGAENAWIRPVEKGHAIGYVTKYLTKDIFRLEKGVKERIREVISVHVDEGGNVVEDRMRVAELIESHARRIRYSRHFFPESVRLLRARLFARADEEGDATIDEGAAVPDGELRGEGWVVEERPEQESEWVLYEREPFTQDVDEYKERVRLALEEVLTDRASSGRRLSRRVLSIWSFQRDAMRPLSRSGDEKEGV